LTIYDLLDEFRNDAHSTQDQGQKFERLMQAFFKTDPLYGNKFSNVWLWQDWPGRNGRPDCGIDLVAQQADSDFITLREIPLDAYDYVVNGKSALDWVMERYQVKTDKDSGIVNDPNAWSEDPRYIVDLVKRVVRVSMETLRLVEALPKLEFGMEEASL